MKRSLDVYTALFLFFHLMAFSVLAFPFRWEYLAVFVIGYFGRMFFITAAYHRYFSHRAYKTSRAFQFLLAFLAMTSSQKGVLWWASHHRYHHRHSDQELDVHSPRHGWWWSHAGWFLSTRYEETEYAKIPDFSRYPELRWLDRHWSVPVWAYASVLFFLGGLPFLAWGFFLSTVVLWHGTFTINSLSHLWGTRRFETRDESRNNFFLSMITLGEGWHNNHHQYPSAACSGLRWWEIDITYYCLRVLSWLQLIRDLRPLPPSMESVARQRLLQNERQ